jgi:WD40 repeat protein
MTELTRIKSPQTHPGDWAGRNDDARCLWDLWRQGEQPSVDDFVAGADIRDPDRIVAVVRVDQWERWRLGQRVPAETYLDAFPALWNHAELVVELLLAEYLLREELGEQPALDEYLDRFPQYAGALDLQLELHQAISADGEPFADWAEKTLTAVDSRDIESGVGSDGLPVIPGYEVLGVLGRGGMGIVYRAWQKELNRLVAVKMLHAGAQANPRLLSRFRVEAEAVGRLRHPNIVQVYEAGQHKGSPFLVLELVEGRSLAESLAGIPRPSRQAAELVETLARAVDFAHRQGVVHRDLTPANVLLTADGRPKITDFGLAKLIIGGGDLRTQTGDLLGTPSYMAPEQAAGRHQAIGAATDVYALGAILYELLTGRPPFKAESALETLGQVVAHEPVAPSRLRPKLPGDLETICLKCLHKEPTHRYASAAELAEDLLRFLENRPIKARRSSVVERFRRWRRRNPAVAALCGVTATLLLTLTVVSATAAMRIDKARQRADDKAAAEKAAREKADDATRAERLERRRAQERLVRLNIVTGNFQAGAQDNGSALLRYSQAWMLDRGDPSTEPMHRLRMACLLERYPRLEGICFHKSPVLEAHFDAAGGRLLTRTEDGRAFLWDPYRSRPIASPLPHDGKVLCAALSPDGKRAVTTGTDGTARLWTAATGQPMGEPLRHPDVVSHAAFGPDGQRLATACNDGTVRFWTVPGGKLLEPKARQTGELRFVGFSPDGRLIVTVDGHNAARVWDAAAGRPLTPPMPHRLTPGSPTDFLFQPPFFSPDSARLLTADERSVQVLDARTGAQAVPRRKFDFVLNHAALSSDGGRILVVGKWSWSDLLDAASGRTIRSFDHPREVQAGCLSADGKRVATSSTLGVIHVRDAQTGDYIVRPFAHAASLTQLTFTPDGDRLLSVSLDGTVRIWNVGFEPFKEVAYDDSCGYADRLFLAGRCLSADGLWEVRPEGTAGARLQRRRSEEPGRMLAHPGPVQKARFAPDGRSVLTADELRVQVWDAGTGRARGPLLAVNGSLIWAQFSDDGGRLMLIDGGGTVSVHATESSRVVLGPIALDAKLLSECKHLICKVVTLSPDGRRLAVHFPGRVPRETRVYEVETGRHLAMTNLSSGLVSSLAFSPDSTHLVSAATDTLARVWDAETGKPISPPMRHPTFVWRATFAPDGRLVVTLDGTHVRLWDSATGDLLTQELPHRLGFQADAWVSRDGRSIVGVAPGGAAQQWELPTFDTAADRVISLVQLLTGQQVDANDGIAPLEPSAFLDTPEDYRLAWLSWRGLSDGRAVPSCAEGEKHRCSWSAMGSNDRPGFTGGLQEASAAAARELARGRTQVALGHLVKLSAANPADTELALKVGALQAWFGQDREFADTCRRALDFATGSFDPSAAERTAKVCSLCPSQDKTRVGAALTLARNAVALGNKHKWLPWFQMALGMAEYRSGHFVEADDALIAAESGAKKSPHVVGTSAFYRAMSLFRQGREKEARELFIRAASEMKPLPKDEKNPLADNAAHDDLILWMAYKEASGLIKPQLARAAPGRRTGNERAAGARSAPRLAA